MSRVDSADETDDRGGVSSGAPVSAGSDMVLAYALALVLVALPAVILGWVLFAVLPVLPWWLGVLLGLAAAAGYVWLRVRRADRIVLARLGEGVPQARIPVRLTNMVEGLTLAGGVAPPELVLLDDPAHNAMAVRCQDRNHLVFTRGLVEALEVVELEGVVAALLTRLRNGDADAATLGAALFGRPMIDGPVGSVLAPVGTAALDRLLSADRDLDADRLAVSLTRYPPGLLRALRAMSGEGVRPATVSDGTAHLWLVDPVEGRATGGRDRRSPLGLRIDVLAEL